MSKGSLKDASMKENISKQARTSSKMFKVARENETMQDDAERHKMETALKVLEISIETAKKSPLNPNQEVQVQRSTACGSDGLNRFSTQ